MPEAALALEPSVALTRDDRFWPVEISGLTYAAGGKTLVDDLSLRIVQGPVTAIMGPNGAGKSVTLRLIAGLIRPTAGTMSYGGAPTPDANQIAVVFQRPVLLRRSVAANLDHALKTYGVSRDRRRERVEALLALGQLEDLARQPARVLSGGEQQRLALVRALAAEPRLLMLDEPTASLDPQATAAIEGLIARAAADGIKVLLITHDRGQAQRVAADVLFMHAGRIVEQTPTDRFFDRPQSPEAAAYNDGRLLLPNDTTNPGS